MEGSSKIYQQERRNSSHTDAHAIQKQTMSLHIVNMCGGEKYQVGYKTPIPEEDDLLKEEM